MRYVSELHLIMEFHPFSLDIYIAGGKPDLKWLKTIAQIRLNCEVHIISQKLDNMESVIACI